MELGMSLVLSPALEQRLRLEQELEQSLLIVHRIALTLKMYQRREQALTTLYRKAVERGSVRRYDKHGMQFEFALVRRHEVPAELRDQLAFSHCLFRAFDALFGGTRFALARGSWLLFVVEDFLPNIPPAYLEYAAV